MAKKIFITAGEVSGDMNASHLVRAVREIDDSFEFVGIGGRHLKDAGVRLIADSSAWGSVGFFEGVARFPRVYPVLRRLGAIFDAEKPDLHVPVDYRVFNMRAAGAAKSRGVPVVYFFAPVNWFGTGEKRFVALAETVDLSLVALPLSLDSYRKAGANFEFIGHPLVDVVKPTMSREEALKFFGLEDRWPIIGLMPGSRFQEVKRLLPVFVKSAEMIRKQFPEAQFIALQATGALEPLIKKHIGNAAIKIVGEKTYDFMNVSDLLVLCSGTATHEAALMEKPMVINYKVSAVTAWIVRRTVAPPMIGLPNIIAGEFIVPELVQEMSTLENVTEKAMEILSSEDIRVRMKESLAEVRKKLGEPGVLARAARRVVDAANGQISKAPE
ncbi:MAG: lipid-A-disaccharide synthase [bacterium]